MRKVLTGVAVAMLLTGCVSSKDYKARVYDVNLMKEKASDLQTRVSALEQENTALKNQLKMAQDEKANLETGLKTAQDEKGALEAQLRTTQDEKGVLEAQLRTAQDEKGALEMRLRTAQDEKGALEAQLRTAQDEKRVLEAQLRTAQDQRGALEPRLRTEQDEKRALEARLQNAQNEKMALDTRLRSLEEARSSLQRENTSLRNQINELSRQRDTALAEKDKAISGFKSTYDNLVKELKNEIEAGQVAITQLKDKLSLSLVEKVLFDSGRADIKKEGKKVLDRVAGILKQVTDKQINIEGHTDNVPISPKLQNRFPTNWELSTTRATNVVRYLQEKGGLDPRLLTATGSSEYHPIDSNETGEGRSKNRRIEIVLIPMGLEKAEQ